MSLCKLGFFTMLATIVAFVAVGRLNVQIKRFGAPGSSSQPRGPALAADESLCYTGQPTNELWQIHGCCIGSETQGPSTASVRTLGERTDFARDDNRDDKRRGYSNRETAIDRLYWVNAFRAKSEIRPAVFLPVQSKDAKDLGAGKLLVASRRLGDPNFVETVVLLVHYDAEGAVGLILNRRTRVPLSRVLVGLKAAQDRSDTVYLGGPVETPAVFALLKSPTRLEGGEHVFGGVYLISSKTLFERTISARPDPSVFHVYLGYAGWTKDQLQKEVAQGAWFIFQADAGKVFDSDPDSLWPQMIQKTELKLARGKLADQWMLLCRRMDHQRGSRGKEVTGAVSATTIFSGGPSG